MRKEGRSLVGAGFRTDQEGLARQGIHTLGDGRKGREQEDSGGAEVQSRET